MLVTGKMLTLEPEKAVAWYANVVLTGYQFKKTDDGWRLMLKAMNPKGQPMVTFITAHSIATCYEIWWAGLTKNSYKFHWKDDKWAD